MKRTLLVFFTLVVAIMSFRLDFVDITAKNLEMTREEVQACFNKTGVTLEDIMHFNEIIVDDLQTVDFDESALTMGCLFACLHQKMGAMTGAHINVDHIKHSAGQKMKLGSEKVAQNFEVLDTCADRVKEITNECEVGLKLVLCFMQEMKRAYKNDNSNE